MARSENLETALEPCQSFLCMIQCVIEGLPARYHKDTLKIIIEETSKFWKIQNVSGPVEKECVDLLKLADFFCKFWIYFVIVLTFSYNLAPAFLGGLPYPCYVPGGHRLLIYVVQMYATGALMVTLVGIASTFVSVCAETVVQYRLLEEEFVGLDSSFTRNGRNYRELVDHHGFLFEYCEHLRRYGSEIFVLKVALTSAMMCLHLYITAQGDFSLAKKIKCGIFFAGQIFDFALYCVPAELVTSASIRAGDAIYSSDWLSKNVPEMRKAMVMVLVRAQKQFDFVGHGLVILNLRTFTQVFKTALSFCAYLKTMSTKGTK